VRESLAPPENWTGICRRLSSASAYGLGVGKFNLGAGFEHLDHYGHGGSWIGYDALMVYLPQHHATVVALFNENWTVGFTAGPLLEAVDRNLRELG